MLRFVLLAVLNVSGSMLRIFGVHFVAGYSIVTLVLTGADL